MQLNHLAVELMLVLMVVILGGVITWLLWTTLSIRGSISRTEDIENSRDPARRRTRQMRAEVFVETFRGRRGGAGGAASGRERGGAAGRGRDPDKKGNE